ncbi:4Fe-4S dicluster domain-containing protein [Holophaga foetida]|uniref:4Fe-4S dicluster domain-containing protein n=1 Tax=Holophaga foetida TaxID=35839 RepID=UPI0002471818|nr:4Fe-4S dicluster domain-containing protein [Holophaga foetida]
MNGSNAVLVDLTQCVGCGSCTVACKLWNGKPYDKGAPATGLHPVADHSNWTTLTQRKAEKDGAPAWRFVKAQCMHCEEPACVSSCMSKAMRKTEQGPVVYRPDLCAGCRYCMMACPFEVPKYEWGKVIPSVSKCQMCSTRLAHGRSPACTDACPTGALRFGRRQELLGIAHDKLKTGRYVNKVYGEREAGGTSWLYISDIPFGQLGFKANVTSESLPAIAEHYMRKTPALLLGGAALFMGLSKLIQRKKAVAAAEEGKREQ